VSVRSTDLEGDARAVSLTNRFDVVPTDDSTGPVQEYYGTAKWNDFSSVSRKRISHPDTIPLETKGDAKTCAPKEREGWVSKCYSNFSPW
jgi:hypothetical protein